MKNMKNFSPLLFLASLGAGGISVSFFAFINYTVKHPKGLAAISHIHGNANLPLPESFFYALEIGMILFSVIHFFLTILFLAWLIKWVKTDEYKKLLNNPLASSAIMAPFISITMTMNVLLAVVRYFFPVLSQNLQSMMFPGFVAWSLIWFFLLRMEIEILTIAFKEGFDVNKISFGWLLHPFALGMLTVTGMGIAALSKNAELAHLAAFMSLVSGSMGIFLLVVKMVTIFKSHFSAKGLPENQFLPGFLIVIPNITLYAISLFRFGHYLEHHQGAHLESYFMVVMTAALAFETWYFIFGLSLLKDYFRRHFHKEFTVTQWGFICPLVAYAVLGSFVFASFYPSSVLYWLIIFTMFFNVIFFLALGKKQLECWGMIKARRSCE